MLRAFLLPFLLFAPPLALPAAAQEQVAQVPQGPEWPFAETDLPVDPAWRFGTLANGMRYLIRPNATPAGQASVQFWVDGGSLDEREDELGFAHFIEHMAFNGSTHVPEGEMVRLLEREGLAFGADTNASTGFDQTLYRLDLPRNDPALLDTALMLMRETASELSFDPQAVEREKGVVLSERRVRDTFALRNGIDNFHFLYPGSRFAERMPIGTVETLRGATAEGLRGLWQRLYRPENTALVVVGEFDPDLVEAEIATHFADWTGPEALPGAGPGPIPFDRAGETDIYIDPALSEEIVVAAHGPWLDEPDSVAARQRNLLRQIGYGIVNRRLQRLARAEDPPFQSAGLGTGDVFEAGRTTRLVVNAGDGEWQQALSAAQEAVRRALQFGFSEAEVAEQVANLRTGLEDAAAGAGTRPHGAFVGSALALLTEGQIPTTPQSSLARFEQFAPQITPESVMAALQTELVPLDDPLIRFEGRTAPEGGEAALRSTWNEGMATEIAPLEQAGLSDFAYNSFGTPGEVVSDTALPELGIRELVFANGLKLNLKPTQLQQGRIAVQMNIDGGEMLNNAEDPLATSMVGVLPAGGLGRHTTDELQSILAGRSVDFAIGAADESFVMGATTTKRDLELQLQLLAAAVTDPGYRPQGEAQYRRNIRNYFAQIDATPAGALGAALGAIVSDEDPRFSLQPEEAYLALSFERLRIAIADRLAKGAMELALVGDFEEQRAVELVAATLGALPPREEAFRAYEDNRARSFTGDRSQRIVRHEGAADQALIRLSWPTTDDSDLAESLRLELLERVMQLELTDQLREELGQTYSPGVSADQSRTWTGYGQFSLSAAIDTQAVDAAREAMLDAVRALAAEPVADDVLLRARQPLLEAYDNALKTNAGWMNIVDRAQSEPERIERFLAGKALLAGITAEEIRATAARYLRPEQALEVLALPREPAPAAPPAG